jgi:hypothetical protein
MQPGREPELKLKKKKKKKKKENCRRLTFKEEDLQAYRLIAHVVLTAPHGLLYISLNFRNIVSFERNERLWWVLMGIGFKVFFFLAKFDSTHISLLVCT